MANPAVELPANNGAPVRSCRNALARARQEATTSTGAPLPLRNMFIRNNFRTLMCVRFIPNTKGDNA